MSLYSLPKGINAEMMKAIRSFWWKGNYGSGINWISWDTVCRMKAEARLGFKDLHVFNQTLLAK